MVSFLKKNHLYITLAFVLALYFFFSIQHLGKFITADEHYWVYERIPQYWNAIADGNWKKTYINDKPGVTLALVSGAGLWAFPDPSALCSRTPERIITCDTVRTENMLFTFRFFILCINALLIFYLFWIIKKITNPAIALWSTFFIALSPILLGISQIINSDALLWSFGAAAFFSYFAAIRYQERKYIFFSGLFLGFALLSKYTASILIPFFLFTSLFSTFFSQPMSDRVLALGHIRKNLVTFFLTLLLAVIVVSFFLPAVWLKPSILQTLLSGGGETPFIFVSSIFFAIFCLDVVALQGRCLFFFHNILQKVRALQFSPCILPWSIFFLFMFLIIGRILFPDWNLFITTPFDIKDLTSTYNGYDINPNFFESLLLEIQPIAFSLTPIVLFFFLVALLRAPFINTPDTPWKNEVLMTITFLPIFIFLLIFLDVLATPRYIILLYPIITFLAACGAWESYQYIKKKYYYPTAPANEAHRKNIAIIFIVLCSMGSIVTSQPFYFDYTNALLPKQFLISDAWGYGGYEATQYLNALPNAENLLIWTDYEGVCEFFVGKCMLKQYKYSSKQKIDYAVLTRRGKILYDPNHSRWMKEGNLLMQQAYDNPNPDWLLEINGRPENFVKVVKIIE